jgi:hypothetical protein
MVRLNGCAAVGAVDVLGGAENVRPPREPELPPPPTRASAAEMASIKGNANDKTTAIAWTMPRVRCVNFMSVSLSPRQGEARLRWAPLLKSESHYQEQRLRPSVAGMRQLGWLFGRRARLIRQSAGGLATASRAFKRARSRNSRFAVPAEPVSTLLIAPYDGAMVSFTAATSWLSVKGFGRNANC